MSRPGGSGGVPGTGGFRGVPGTPYLSPASTPGGGGSGDTIPRGFRGHHTYLRPLLRGAGVPRGSGDTIPIGVPGCQATLKLTPLATLKLTPAYTLD